MAFFNRGAGRQSKVSQKILETHDLASMRLDIRRRRFYLDVKKNKEGNFIKIAEVGVGGAKTRLIFAQPAAVELRAFLQECIYTGPDPSPSNEKPVQKVLKSELMVHGNRKYFLDLIETPTEIFLLIRQILYQGPAAKYEESKYPSGRIITIPAEGLVKFRDALGRLMGEHTAREEELGERPKSSTISVDQQRFFFDISANQPMATMRLSQVKPEGRSSINIPQLLWTQFGKIFDHYANKMSEIEERERVKSIVKPEDWDGKWQDHGPEKFDDWADLIPQESAKEAQEFNEGCNPKD